MLEIYFYSPTHLYGVRRDELFMSYRIKYLNLKYWHYLDMTDILYNDDMLRGKALLFIAGNANGSRTQHVVFVGVTTQRKAQTLPRALHVEQSTEYTNIQLQAYCFSQWRSVYSIILRTLAHLSFYSHLM
jgi:hypothetical protein